MKAEEQKPAQFLPLTPAVFQIMLALADRERHGYSILREIEIQTAGSMHIGPTTLYRSIKRMLEDGLIIELGERPDPELDDERRRYYRLTTLGTQVAVAETNRLVRAIAVARRKPLLKGLELEGTL